jgi:hypothetical protein
MFYRLVSLWIHKPFNSCSSTRPIVWNNSGTISNLLHSLSVNLWGIEIDAFAYHLCKINISLHILPLYKRFLHLTSHINDLKLYLFCNNTLNLYLPKWDFPFLLSILRTEFFRLVNLYVIPLFVTCMVS